MCHIHFTTRTYVTIGYGIPYTYLYKLQICTTIIRNILYNIHIENKRAACTSRKLGAREYIFVCVYYTQRTIANEHLSGENRVTFIFILASLNFKRKSEQGKREQKTPVITMSYF